MVCQSLVSLRRSWLSGRAVGRRPRRGLGGMGTPRAARCVGGQPASVDPLAGQVGLVGVPARRRRPRPSGRCPSSAGTRSNRATRWYSFGASPASARTSVLEAPAAVADLVGDLLDAGAAGQPGQRAARPRRRGAAAPCRPAPTSSARSDAAGRRSRAGRLRELLGQVGAGRDRRPRARAAHRPARPPARRTAPGRPAVVSASWMPRWCAVVVDRGRAPRAARRPSTSASPGSLGRRAQPTSSGSSERQHEGQAGRRAARGARRARPGRRRTPPARRRTAAARIGTGRAGPCDPRYDRSELGGVQQVAELVEGSSRSSPDLSRPSRTGPIAVRVSRRDRVADVRRAAAGRSGCGPRG